MLRLRKSFMILLLLQLDHVRRLVILLGSLDSESHSSDDLVRSILSAPYIIVDILPSLIPYVFVLAIFGVFVIWNGGIVLGM